MTVELVDVTVAKRGGLPIEDVTLSLDLLAEDRGATKLDRMIKEVAGRLGGETGSYELRIRPRGGSSPNFTHVAP